jgi:hypothetical protein
MIAEHDGMGGIIMTATIVDKVMLDWHRTLDEWVGCDGQARCAQEGKSLQVK